MNNIDPTSVSTKYLAAVLGMTRDGVTRLNRQGVIRQNGIARGKYNLVEAISAYATYLRENKDDAAVKVLNQKIRKLRLANDKVEDSLVEIEQAAKVFSIAAHALRNIVEEMPGRVCTELADTSNPLKIHEVLKREISGVFFEYCEALGIDPAEIMH